MFLLLPLLQVHRLHRMFHRCLLRLLQLRGLTLQFHLQHVHLQDHLNLLDHQYDLECCHRHLNHLHLIMLSFYLLHRLHQEYRIFEWLVRFFLQYRLLNTNREVPKRYPYT